MDTDKMKKIRKVKASDARFWLAWHEQLRKELWAKTCAAAHSSGNTSMMLNPTRTADYALSQFDERFPANDMIRVKST